MKRKSLFLAGVASMAIALVSPAFAALETEKQAAIDRGLDWLASRQVSGGPSDGSWNYGGGAYNEAATGAVVSAFLSQYDSWKSGPNAATYTNVVNRAVDYLMRNAVATTVSTRNDGVNICPGGGSCGAAYWVGSGESTYTTGLVAPALATYATVMGGGAAGVATTAGPLAGQTWGQVAQRVTNAFAAGQSTALNGNRRGGWRYFPGTGDSDSSTTQWAVISMIYNETLGAITPGITRTDLGVWLGNAQAPSGVVCYQPGVQPCDHSDTGGWLLAKQFIGQGGDAAVQRALDWLNDHWNQTANGTWYGIFGHPYATWSVYKGLETTIGLDDTGTITNLMANACGNADQQPGNPPGSTPCNWYQNYNEYLVRTQNANGSWSGYSYWTDPLSTAFDISILSATSIPVNPVPEPAALALLGAGLVGLGLVRRRRAAA